MLRSNGGAKRTILRRFLPVILTIILLVPIQNVDAAAQITSGTLMLGNTILFGTTSYSVDYSYPSLAYVGTKLPVTITVHIVALTGLVEYITDYQLIVRVSLGTRVLNGTISGGNNTALPISKYPGSAWGPNTVLIPLTADNTGLAKGQSANATVAVTLEDLVWYTAPQSLLDTEPPMEAGAGSLTIENLATPVSSSTTGRNTGQSQTYLPYALLASGAVLMLSAVFLSRGPRSPQANPK